MENPSLPEGEHDADGVARDYDESNWTWPDWEPTPPAEGFWEAVLGWIFGRKKPKE